MDIKVNQTGSLPIIYGEKYNDYNTKITHVGCFQKHGRHQICVKNTKDGFWCCLRHQPTRFSVHSL